jgi:hypothetical protein
MKITSAKIGPYPRPMPIGLADPMPKVTATFADGSVRNLFEFFPDEIDFTPQEFVGLTEIQAHELRTRKDVAYLQS